VHLLIFLVEIIRVVLAKVTASPWFKFESPIKHIVRPVHPRRLWRDMQCHVKCICILWWLCLRKTMGKSY